MRYHHLVEARRNPDQNPKENSIKTLMQYNNSGYYMSYTSIDKIGLNPRSGYNTPIGIYSYPIVDKITDTIVVSDNLSRVPYMGEVPYIWIFKPKNPDKGLIISEYEPDDFYDDVRKMFLYVSKKDKKIAAAMDSIEEVAILEARMDTPASHIWNFSRILALLLSGNESLEKYTTVTLKNGDLVTEINKTKVGKIIDVYSDQNEYVILYPDGDEVTVKFDEVEQFIPPSNESVVLEYQKNTQRANSSAVIWTYLLYNVLGYDYVDDSEGTGLIHKNEPAQAVFFNSSVIEVVRKLDNPNKDTDELSINSVFYYTKKTDEVERIDPKITEKLFKHLLKQKVVNISGQIPSKFMGHIVVNSSKLQAQLLLNDGRFVDYFKNINRDTIDIMDSYMIKKIQDIPSSSMEEQRHLFPIFNYFNRFHNGNWPEGERAILNKAYNDKNAVLIIEYCYRVRKKAWPEAEFIILKQPSSIPSYAKQILRQRWPEGEQVLSHIDKQRGSWVLEQYAAEFNISVEDIGKI